MEASPTTPGGRGLVLVPAQDVGPPLGDLDGTGVETLGTGIGLRRWEIAVRGPSLVVDTLSGYVNDAQATIGQLQTSKVASQRRHVEALSEMFVQVIFQEWRGWWQQRQIGALARELGDTQVQVGVVVRGAQEAARQARLAYAVRRMHSRKHAAAFDGWSVAARHAGRVRSHYRRMVLRRDAGQVEGAFSSWAVTAAEGTRTRRELATQQRGIVGLHQRRERRGVEQAWRAWRARCEMRLAAAARRLFLIGQTQRRLALLLLSSALDCWCLVAAERAAERAAISQAAVERAIGDDCRRAAAEEAERLKLRQIARRVVQLRASLAFDQWCSVAEKSGRMRGLLAKFAGRQQDKVAGQMAWSFRTWAQLAGEISTLIHYLPYVLYGECVINAGGCCLQPPVPAGWVNSRRFGDRGSNSRCLCSGKRGQGRMRGSRRCCLRWFGSSSVGPWRWGWRDGERWCHSFVTPEELCAESSGFG